MKPNESKTKLPEGVPVRINALIKRTTVSTLDMHGQPISDPNGYAFTYRQLAERDRAIARAAYWVGHRSALSEHSSDYKISADDYLQSEEFKELTK